MQEIQNVNLDNKTTFQKSIDALRLKEIAEEKLKDEVVVEDEPMESGIMVDEDALDDRMVVVQYRANFKIWSGAVLWKKWQMATLPSQ